MTPVFSRRSWLHATGLASLLGTAGTLVRSARLRGAGAPAEPRRPPRASWWARPRPRHRGESVGDRIRPRRVRAVVELQRAASAGPRAGVPGNAAIGWDAAAGVQHLRGRSRDRDCPRRVLSGMDLQRTGAGPDHPCDRRRSAEGHLPQPGVASAHDPLPRVAPAGHGRVAAAPAGNAGRNVRVRVRRRPRRSAFVSLPCRSAASPHSQGPVRRVHHRPARRAPRHAGRSRSW